MLCLHVVTVLQPWVPGRFGPGSRAGHSGAGVWDRLARACRAAPRGASSTGALRRSGPGCAVAQPGATTRRAANSRAHHGAPAGHMLCLACQRPGSVGLCWPNSRPARLRRRRALPAQRQATLPARPARPNPVSITLTLIRAVSALGLRASRNHTCRRICFIRSRLIGESAVPDRPIRRQRVGPRGGV